MTGKVVSRGKIRVDARKAVAKLREHLLVDLRDYVLELTRSAVAGGAKQLAIDYDANDFIIGWAGAAVDQEPLEHLLDYALADPGDGDTRRLRLLALGVNAALGLEPRFVDVYSAVEASCTRVRFLPAMLSDDGDTRPQAEQVDAPEGMPTTGMRVHVRERLSWHVVRRATKLAGPPELESLAKGCLHLPATIEVRGQPRVNSERYPPLLRVEFDVPGCDRAFVDLMPAEFSPAVVDLLEQGVRLAHHEWTSDDIPATAAQLPVRVVVDARVLPTNASRSRVREESSLYRHIKETSRAALMSALHAVLSGAELPSNMTLLGERGAAEHAAARCLDAIMIRWRQGKHISPAARNLLDLPLLRNGIGDALSYADLPSGNAVMVYRGHKALEAELSLWMRDVVWLRGVPCELPMQHVTQHDVSGHIERAREGVARRDAFMAHEPSGPVLGESADYLVKGAFRAPAGELAGLHGEVAVVDAPASSRGPRVRIFFEDRPLDVRDLDPVWVPLPLDIALAWPDHLLPSWGFDGVTQSAQLNTAIAYAVMSGVGLLAKRTGMIAQHPQIRGLLRAAVGTVLQAEMGLQVDVDFELENDARELIRARIWPTTDPAKFASVVDIQKQRARYAALFTAAPGTIGSAADGRTVLAVATTESGWLWRALAGEVNLVDYTRAVLSPGGRHESWEERKRTAVRKAYNALLDVQLHGRPVSLNIDRPGVHARIGIGSPGRVGRLHAGLPVETTIHPPRFGLVNLAIDDDELVPNMTWTEAQRASPEDDLEAELELELLNEVVAAVEGDEQARQRLNNWPDEMTLPLRRYLLDSVTKLRNELGELAVDDPRREPLKSLYDHALVAPLLSLLNQKGEPVPRSLLHVQRRFSGAESIPTLMEPPGFETLDWYPIIEPEAALWHHIASAVGWRLHNAVGELSGREYMAGQERRRKQILEQPSLAIERMGDRAAPGAPVAIHETGAAGDRMIVAVSLPAQNAPKETHVEVLYHRRLIFDTQLTSFGPPVVARVNFSTADEFVGWADLNAIGYQRAHQAIAEAASQLVIKLLATDEPLAQPNALALIVSVASLGVSDTLKAKLENTAWWPTIRGKDTTLAKLLRPGRQIYTGRSRYERWWSAKRGFTELDRPILYIQDGHAELFATLFDALAINAEDVTDAVASLQQQRSQGPGDAPKLAGEPAHTLLRESATELGVLVARGEVELTPVGPPRVVVTDIHGTAHRVTAVNELPINATLAMDGLATKPNMDRLASELRWAVERWTQKLATQVGELPEFVRAIIREMIWRRTRQAEPQLADELLKAPVWQDIRGNWHSIDRLTNSKFKRVWFTMKQPPYPAHDFKRPIIRLSSHLADEVDNLRKLLPLSSATTRLENMLEGETRRSAAPRDSFSLDAVSRAACLETVRLDGAMTGELGVLSPSTRGYQRIDVHATRRPVCTIDDDLAWPVVAVINDDTLDVGMYFNRISEASETALRYQLHSRAQSVLRQRIVAPSYAIAEAWLDNTAELDDESKTAVVGRIWLAPSWNQSHRVKLTTQRKTESIVLHTLHGSRFFRHELPIEGEVMVLTKSPPQQIASVVTAMVKPRLPEMIAAASENFPESREQLEGYRWILWLLDVAAGLIPNVKAVDNSLVDPPRILSELNTRGAIWYAASGGDADGAFPDQPHGFMLRADQAPVLIDVLRERLKQPVLKRLGGHVSTAPVTTPSTATAEASQQPATEKAAQREAADDPSRRSWFRSALGSITAMWSADDDDTNDDGEVIEATPAHPLALLLHRELLALSMPRHDIDIEPGGKRAVDYSKRKSRIVLNADHPAVQAVSGDDPPAPALASLIAAIIGEINRAHKNITAVDEQQALLKLLDGG